MNRREPEGHPGRRGLPKYGSAAAGNQFAWLRWLIAPVILLVSLMGAKELLRAPETAVPPPSSDAVPLQPPASAHTGQLSVVAPDAGVAPGKPHPLTEALCPEGMVWVAAEFCPGGLNRFGRCPVERRSIGTCVDRFEYPNQPGVLPAVMLNFYDARRVCRAEGKRLCADAEWQVACQGVSRLGACNYGQTGLRIPVERLWDPKNISSEVAARDGRRPSRESGCVSRFGAFDMSGNVREWVTSEHAGGYVAALKGGRYNQGSISCGRSIQTRQPSVRLPHTGVRCCRDPLVLPPRQRDP